MPYRRRKYRTKATIRQEGYTRGVFKPQPPKKRKRRRRDDPDDPKRRPRDPIPVPRRKKRDGNREPVRRNPYAPTRGSPIDTINRFIRRSIRNPFGPLGQSNAIRNLPFPFVDAPLWGPSRIPKWIPKL